MAYDIKQFVADCRDILGRDPGPTGREQVRANLERLLANEEFIDECCGDAVSCGLKVLYEDPTLGFQILAHINDKARVSPPHAKLKPIKKYRLTPGKAGIYQDGTIHSIDYPDHARFIRVTGTNLDKIDRIKINLETGAIEKMYAQRAT